MLTLEGAGGQTDDTRSTFRVPLKTLGYNGSKELCGCGRSIASKFTPHQVDEICLWVAKKIIQNLYSEQNGRTRKFSTCGGHYSNEILEKWPE